MLPTTVKDIQSESNHKWTIEFKREHFFNMLPIARICVSVSKNYISFLQF